MYYFFIACLDIMVVLLILLLLLWLNTNNNKEKRNSNFNFNEIARGRALNQNIRSNPMLKTGGTQEIEPDSIPGLYY